MDVVATVDVPVSAETLFAFIADLTNYTQWLELVHCATPDANQANLSMPCWTVELRARLGVFARSKRLRMCRTVCDAPNTVVFERREQDSRRHSAWVLRANVSATPTGAMLETNLHYSGNLFTGGTLERALADQITSGREKLIKQLTAK